MSLLQRFTSGFRLAGRSVTVVRRNPTLAVFPLVSVLAGGAFIAAAFGGVTALGGLDSTMALLGVLALVYFGTAFVATFCNAALMWAANETFEGRDPSVVDAMRGAAGHLPGLLTWAFVSALVGLLIQSIEESSDIAGAILAAVLSLGWTAMTYFVVPVVLFEGAGPRSMFPESVALVRETWGEAIGAETGTGVVAFLLALPGLVVAVLCLLALSGPVQLAGVVAGGLLMLAGVLFGTALGGVVKVAVYRYARVGESSGPFDESMLEGAFREGS